MMKKQSFQEPGNSFNRLERFVKKVINLPKRKLTRGS